LPPACRRTAAQDVLELIHESDGLQDLGHPLVLLGEIALELRTREIIVEPIALGELLLPLLRLDHRIDDSGQLFAVRLRNTGRCHDRTPVADDEVYALLLEGGRIDARYAFVAAHPQPPQLAGVDLRLELRGAVDAERDVSAEDRGHSLAAAGMGDVIDLR